MKLSNAHLTEWKLPTLKVSQFSAKSSGKNGVYKFGRDNEIACNMIIDTGSNMTTILKDPAERLGEKLIWTPPHVTLQTLTGDKIEIYEKMNISIKFRNAAIFLHAIYVADITDPFTIGVDFFQDHGFMLDLTH